MNSRERFFAALNGTEPDHLPVVPISMMVAADLIDVPYKKYATDYREQVKGQIAFAEKFGIDHVSAISDPATEAADCGAEIVYHEHQPPALDEQTSLLRDKTTFSGLKVPDPYNGTRMTNRLRVIEDLKRQVGNELIIEGWVEGPVAEASDLRGINRFMMDFFDDPEFVNDLFEFIYEMEMQYAEAQIKAGADIIGIGDAAASLIGPQLYEEFALEYHKRYVDRIHELGALVRLHICGNATHVLPWLPDIKPDVMDLDSAVSVSEARENAGPDQILTGNIDPVRVLKDTDPPAIREAMEQCFTEASRTKYMIAAGCEIPRATPDENIAAMCDFGRERGFEAAGR